MFRFSALLFGLICLSLSGCSTLFMGSVEQESYHQHVVTHQGETLSAIASWYTGKSRNWSLIQTHNPRLNVHKIQLGQEIRIPMTLVRKLDSLPKRYVERWNGAVTSPSSHKLKFQPVSIKLPSEPRFNNSSTPMYPSYDLRSISGCEKFSGSETGLHDCAETVSERLHSIISKSGKI